MSLIRLRPSFTLPRINLTTPVKITIISVGVGVTLIGLVARYLRRRRRSRIRHFHSNNVGWKGRGPASVKSPNGDANFIRRSASPAHQRSMHRQGSVSLSSDHHSSASIASTLTLEAAASLTPQQLGLMGMEALETAIGYWEDALNAYVPPSNVPAAPLAITDKEESEFSHHVERVLEAAYALQDRCERLFLNQSSVLFRDDSVSEKFVDLDRRTITSISSVDSFVSAQDVIADLREFDEFQDLSQDVQHLALYQAALRQLEDDGISFKTLRTEYVKCQTDIEYLAKVHCIRQAFHYLLEDAKNKEWFVNCGRNLVSHLLIFADKDPKDFLTAFDEMLQYISQKSNWTTIEEELRGRGVKCMTFYDIVLDFILLDAFEDLENPPSSVLAVVQNRWLSNGFKETALATAVWSVLKAKRRMLKFPNGFIAHFYNISQQTSPVFAWGFLGPDEDLKEICHFFKDQVLAFLQDIFNTSRARYTCVEDLASDVMEIAKAHNELMCQKFT